MEKSVTDLSRLLAHPDWTRRFERNITLYMFQLLNGLSFMHQNLVWHLDLKPANLLIFGQRAEVLKITDFGLSISGPFDWRTKWLEVVTLIGARRKF